MAVKCAVLVGAAALCAVLGAPTAGADVAVDGVSTVIQDVRQRSGCAPLNHSAQLDAIAQDYVRAGVLRGQAYPGYTTPFIATGRPVAAAITQVTTTAKGLINDCRWVDVGVGTMPNGDYTVLAIVLGSITGPQAAGGLPL